jgi:uncharacterized membrane protein YgcG
MQNKKTSPASAILILVMALAILLAPRPAIAYTLDNQLQYPFPSDFQAKIEKVESRQGLRFFILAAPYDRSKVLPSSQSAGAAAADKAAEQLSLSSGYDAKADTVIVWLQDINDKSRGSFGVSPGELLKSFSVEKGNLTNIVLASIKPHMPGNPAEAIKQVAENLNKEIEKTQVFRGLIWGILDLLMAVSVVSFLLFLVALKISNDQKRKADLLAVANKIAKLKSQVQGWSDYSKENLEAQRPSIFFDLKAASEDSADEFINRFEELALEYLTNASDCSKAIDAAEKEMAEDIAQLFRLEVYAEIPKKIDAEKAIKKRITQLLISLEAKYGDWLKSSNDADRFTSLRYSPIEGVLLNGKAYRIEHKAVSGADTIPRSFADHCRLLLAEEERGLFQKTALKAQQLFEFIESSEDLLIKPRIAAVRYNLLTATAQVMQARAKLIQGIANWPDFSQRAREVISTSEVIPLEQLQSIANDISNRFSDSIGRQLSYLSRIEEEERQVQELAEKARQIEWSTASEWSIGSNGGSPSSSSSGGDYGSSSSGGDYGSSSSGGDYGSSSGGGDY